MGLMKPPNILTFLIAVVLVVVAVLSRFGDVMPMISGQEFWLLLAANVLFILGTVTRGF